MSVATIAVDATDSGDVGKRRGERRGSADDVDCAGVDGSHKVDDDDDQRQSSDDGHAEPERQGHGVRRSRTDRRPGCRDREGACKGERSTSNCDVSVEGLRRNATRLD